MSSSYLLRGCCDVHKDTPEGQRFQKWVCYLVLSPLPAAYRWYVPPLYGWTLMKSHWAVTAAASGGQHPAPVCGCCTEKHPCWGRWGVPGGRWRGSSPRKKQPGRGQQCGVCWLHSNPSLSPLCPLWLWAAGVLSWTAVWTAAAWLRKKTRRKEVVFLCRRAHFQLICDQFYSKSTD